MKRQPLPAEPKVLVRSLASDLCPSCAGRKKPGNTLCFSCYSKLPRQAKSNLYNRVGEGYEPAVAAALVRLGVDDPTWPGEQGALFS